MNDETSLQPVSWRDALALCARYWLRERRAFGGVVLLILLGVVADVLTPVAAGLVVEGVTHVQSTGAGAQAAVWALVLAATTMLAHAGLKHFSDRSWNALTARNMARLQTDIFARVQRFSSDWHANTFSGATIHRLSRGRWAFDMMSAVLWTRFLPLGLTILGLGLVMASRDLQAGAVFFAVVAVYLAVSARIAADWVRPANLVSAAADSRLTGAMADAITNNAAIKAFGAEAREDRRLRADADRWVGLAARSWNRATDLNTAQTVMWTALQFLVLLLLVGVAARGRASAGDIAFAIAANFQLGGYLRQVGGDVRTLQRAFGEFADLIAFDRQPFGVADAPAPAPFRPVRGEIVFDRASFAYPGQPPLYDGLDLRIAPGERVGLVGPSGSGKSTFVKLIQRLYDLDGGAIRIDGQDIAAVPQAQLRRAVAMVPQDPVLFHRSLADNIAYGRPDADRAAVEEAARRAHAHEFIERLARGYDTLVGERGVKLSGGERQRVALARAFLADAPILILDEATSSLDTITERLIQSATEALMAGRTTLLIAHRLSTVRAADRIMVFDGGRIVEQGRHAELMARPHGRYRALLEIHVDLALAG